MLYSALYDMCVYDTPEPLRIGNCIPDAKLLSHTQVGVPCTIENMQIMCKLGYEATSPILHKYDWPHNPLKFDKPFDHQRHMAAFLTLYPRAFNLSDMGTGKTLAALWAADYLMLQGLIKKVIILSPLSTINRVWEDEIFTHFLSRRRVSLLYGTREKRLSKLNAEADFYVINHDGLGVGSKRGPRSLDLGDLAASLAQDEGANAVIVDEGSVYKDSATLRYKILRAALSHKPYVWWMTGTPTPTEPTNAWSQARLVRLDYQESFMSFRERTMMRISQFKWRPRVNASEIVAQTLQPAIRYHRDDCLDLPEVMVETRDVELTPAQKKAIDELKKTLKTEIGKGQITAVNEATLRLKLIQIACGAVYSPDHEINKIDCKPRLDVLHEVIEQAGKKVIVFAPLTSVINLLFSELRQKYTVEKVIGNVSAAKRNQIFGDFQGSAEPRIIVADPRTMAHGLTLTAASTTLWYGPTDQPEIYQQANKRMDRPGQTSKMLIVRLAATPIERQIYARLDSQQNMQGLILDLINGG